MERKKRGRRRNRAPAWCAYSLDLRGHRDSAWAVDGDYSLEAFAGDVLAVARSFDQQPVLVGASLGGIASLAAMGEHRETGFGSLEEPVLLVRGRMSDILSEEGAREFLDLVPHARFADVAGAGHMVAGDRNDLFNDAIVQFLEDVRAGAATPKGAGPG